MNADEGKLITLYMDLTGASESCARSVFMLVCPENGTNADPKNELLSEPGTSASRKTSASRIADGHGAAL